MQRAWKLSAILATASLCTLLVAAEGANATPKPATAAKNAPKQAHTVTTIEHKLKNGLRVVLSPDHSAPTYSISVTYNVGSRNERTGRTGFAHLFEHMMFQGSEKVGKGEHMIVVQNNGGQMNGTTNEERTNYFEALPSNQLDLGLFLEADRMRSLAVTQGNLDNQRNAVQEERRLGMDNQPYGHTFERIQEMAFDNFAYKHDTIGSMKDLDAATIEDVKAFFKTYYAPNNAVLVLVGDFDSKAALAKIEKYFGDIPSQPAAAPVDTTEPVQKAERRDSIQDQFAQAPRIDIAFKITPGNTPDFYASDVMLDVLCSGNSSRLYQKLVKEKELAMNVFAFVNPHRGPSMALIGVVVKPGKDMAQIEKIIYDELDRVKKEGITQEEMNKILLQNRRQLIQTQIRTLYRAMRIGEYTTFYNDPNLINTLESKYKKLTLADVQRVTNQYFTKENRTVLYTMPKPAAAAAKAGM